MAPRGLIAAGDFAQIERLTSAAVQLASSIIAAKGA
jgi:hypothetical protein